MPTGCLVVWLCCCDGCVLAPRSLSFSPVRGRGAAAFGELFPDYSSLRTLDLTKCDIDMEGKPALLSLLLRSVAFCCFAFRELAMLST